MRPPHEVPLRYVGAWENDKRHGQGTFTCADGSKCAPTNSLSDDPPNEGPLRYVGTYESDKMHGQGTLTEANGRVYHSGLWKDSKPVK